MMQISEKSAMDTLNVAELANKLSIKEDTIRRQIKRLGFAQEINGSPLPQDVYKSLLEELAVYKPNRTEFTILAAQRLLKSLEPPKPTMVTELKEKSTYGFLLLLAFPGIVLMFFQVPHTHELVKMTSPLSGVSGSVSSWAAATGIQLFAIWITVFKKTSLQSEESFTSKYIYFIIMAVVEFLINVFAIEPWSGGWVMWGRTLVLAGTSAFCIMMLGHLVIEHLQKEIETT